MANLSPFAVVSAAVVALCWWFGLYVLTLYPRSSLARSLGAAIALLGAMGLGETLVMIATSEVLFVLGWRIVFVTSSMLPVLWLQINVFVLPQDRAVWSVRMVRLGWPLAYLLAMPPVTAYLALNFTGSTTFTSKSGVRREMNRYIPIMAWTFGAGVVLTIAMAVSRFFV